MLDRTSGLSFPDDPILAIDPGPTQSGVVLLGPTGVTVAGVFDNLAVRGYVAGAVPHVAIELIRSYGMPVGAEVFDTCIEIGRFVQIADERGAGIDLVPRQKVKLELCGSPRAKDPNVRQALIDLFGGAGAEKKGGPLYAVKSHAWAALAVAVTCARVNGWMK